MPLINFRHDCSAGCGSSCSNLLCSVEAENDRSINDVNQDKEGFETLRVQVDPGAVGTVGPKSVGKAFKSRETPAPKRGNNHVAANGSTIKNHGERFIKGETENGLKVSMPIQIADVKKVLMST